MGLVITLVDSVVGGYDAVPDAVGWVLVVLGLRDLRGRLAPTTLLTLAGAAGAVSLVLLRPAWTADLPESTGWLLSLPQVAFSFVLCREMHRLLAPGTVGAQDAPRPASAESRTLARRFSGLGWLFGVTAAGPVLVYGGGVTFLLTPAALLAVTANVVLVYLLFRASVLVHGPRPPRSAGPD